MTRECATVQSHSGLRRNRKALLSDLSNLVKASKHLQQMANGNPPTQITDEDIDDLILKAFKMVTRAVKFLDIWIEDIGLELSIDASIAAVDAYQDDNSVPPTPPADRVLSESTKFPLPGKYQNRKSNVTRRTSSSIGGVDHARSSSEQTNARPRYSRSSQTFIRPNSHSSRQFSRPPSVQIQTDHRTSNSQVDAQLSRQVTLASEKLQITHELFLGFLSSFIGQRLDSYSSTELLLITQDAVTACRNLLNVVEAVADRDLGRWDAIDKARDNMYARLTELVEAARDVLQPTHPGEEDYLVPAQGKRLADSATACVAGAGDCVAKTRFVIERIGDFDFEPLGLGISTFDVNFGSRQGHAHADSEADLAAITTHPSSSPPQPARTPPPPPLHSLNTDLPLPNNLSQSRTENPTSYNKSLSIHSLLPPIPNSAGQFLESSSVQTSFSSDGDTHDFKQKPFRFESAEISSAGSGSTYIGSMRDSETSVISSTSTRATSPDVLTPQPIGVTCMSHSFCGSQSSLSDEHDDVEAKLLERTFAHELVHNKDGQITGGTLPALIERLTTHDSTPDAMFVSTFYLTFRLFTTPMKFAQALIERFNYAADSPHVSGPVRLRVYNVFKGWMESHWRHDCDKPALACILPFAKDQLSTVLPTAGKRLTELAEKVSQADAPLVPRLISSMGKTNTAIAQYVSPDTPLPPPIITKSQLTSLRQWKYNGGAVSILDFDPLELARQFTIKESRIFCSILPEELLATEWMKKSGSMAMNVRAMSTLSTDLANLVADCILQLEDPHKRAKLIKQWVKIANKCLELDNYDSLMAIICSLNSSTILRLKRTWDIVSAKTKASLENLKSIVEVSRNYAVLRQRLQNLVPPCLPFVGTYLTDLTFVDVGNQTTRHLAGDGNEEGKPVINFDKHMKTARIIGELQRFQIPYRLTEVPELQTWMQDQLVRVRSSDQSNVQNYYRRSLLLEPRENSATTRLVVAPAAVVDGQGASVAPKEVGGKEGAKDKFDIFGLGWVHPSHKEKTAPIPAGQ